MPNISNSLEAPLSGLVGRFAPATVTSIFDFANALLIYHRPVAARIQESGQIAAYSLLACAVPELSTLEVRLHRSGKYPCARRHSRLQLLPLPAPDSNSTRRPPRYWAQWPDRISRAARMLFLPALKHLFSSTRFARNGTHKSFDQNRRLLPSRSRQKQWNLEPREFRTKSRRGGL